LRHRALFLAVAAVALAGANAGQGEAAKAPATPCARWASADLLCWEYGSVASAAPYSTGAPSFKPVRKTRKLRANSTVRVEASSSARVSFGRQARCRFGYHAPLTEFITRYSSDGVSAPPLYWQTSGRSRCEHFGRARSVEYFCEASPTACPLSATTTGYALASASIARPARISQAGETQVIVTIGRLDFCAEDFEVERTGEFGGGSIGGGGYVEVNGVKQLSHEQVTIKEITTISPEFVSHEVELYGEGRIGGSDCIVPRWARGGR
jgi:hypothetical protein